MREAIAKLEATLPLARQREADVKGLAEQGFMNQHAGQDRSRERIERAKLDWREDRFAAVTGDPERIPLPET